MWQKSYDNKPTLYLIPTPIGNLEDITIRALSILKMVDVVFSEDTRVTSNLLNYFKISKKLVSLHNFNEEKEKEKILEYLKDNNNIAIVTDRGTPLISDPGYKTVKYITEQGFNVVSLPGATAFVPALTSSGLSTQNFLFYGFLNSNTNKAKKELEALVDLEYTIIFYEAPHRVKKTLEIMLEIFGNRNISISREISKKFESIYRGTINDLLINEEEIIGEIVIVVDGNKEDICIDESITQSVNNYVKNGIGVMDAIKKVARERKIPKSEIYNEYHKVNK